MDFVPVIYICNFGVALEGRMIRSGKAMAGTIGIWASTHLGFSEHRCSELLVYTKQELLTSSVVLIKIACGIVPEFRSQPVLLPTRTILAIMIERVDLGKGLHISN